MQSQTDSIALPHNREMEMALLGSFLLDPPLMDLLTDLEPADFYLHVHSRVFAMMRVIWERGDSLDTVSLFDEIEMQQAGQVVSPGYILELQNATPASVYAPQYAVKIKRYANLRKYIVMATELARQAYNGTDPDMLFSWLHEQLQIINLGRKTDEAILLWDESFDLYDSILAERKRQAELPPQEREDWSWPWASWNHRIDPLEAGMLATLAGADGAGKTTFAECIAEQWAKRGHKVVFVHFELNRQLMLDRRASRNSGYERRILRSGKLTAEQQNWLDLIRQNMSTWEGNITYLHAPGWSMEQVLQDLKRLKSAGLCDAVILDYLEKAEMSPNQQRRFKSDDSRRESHDVEQLKSFAEQTMTRIVMLAQLNKEAKRESGNHLTRMGIRGAGEKTEKANLVVLLHREISTNGERDEQGNVLTEPGGYSRKVKVIVNKQTVYATGAFEQFFKGEVFKVVDYA